MKEIYVKPTAQSIELETTNILLVSGSKLALEESVVNASDLTRIIWDDMLSID